MNPRSLTTHFHGLPRPVALSRSARPLRAVLASRSYTAQAEASTTAKDMEGRAPQTGAEAAGSAEVQAAREEAEKRAVEFEKKVKDLEKDVLYHRAEIQTLNRRVADERAKASEFAITSFARSLLSTTDVLTTALSHVPKPLDTNNAPLVSLFNGVELTQRAMFKTFSEAGVRKMEIPQGTVFDPNQHEATYQIPKEAAGKKSGGGEWGAGEVVEVGKEGWMIGNRVLRPAQVGVTQIE